MRNKLALRVLSVLISLALVAVLLRYVSKANIVDAISRLTVTQIALSVVMILLTNIMRGLRLSVFLADAPGARAQCIAISIIHNFMNHVVPFRMGEAALPVLLNRFKSWKLMDGAVVLLTIRIYDLAAMGLVVIVSGLFVDVSRRYAFIALVLVGLAVITLVAVRPSRVGRVHSGKARTGHLEQVLRKVLALNFYQSVISLPLISIAIWVMTYIFFYCVVDWLGIDIGFFESVLASTGAVLTNLLPVNGLGSIGTLEAGWSLGYVFFGVDSGNAVASGFIMHAIVILVGMAAAPFCYLYLRQRSGFELKN